MDILSQIFPLFSQVSVCLSEQMFSFTLLKSEENFSVLDQVHLNDINVINRLIGLLKIKSDDLVFLKHLSLDAFEHLKYIRHQKAQALSSYDVVALLFHMRLLGDAYLDLNDVKQWVGSAQGYERTTKALTELEWNNIFNQLQINDQNLKNKVMYDY